MDSVSLVGIRRVHSNNHFLKDVQEVMDVEKTVSPQMLRGAPNARPAYDCPLFKCKTAGKRISAAAACVASPRRN